MKIIENQCETVATICNTRLPTVRRKSSARKELIVFPNPTSGIINITGITQPADIQVFNLNGQLVKSLRQVQGSIDLTNLGNGVYFLNLQVGDQGIVRKIVKE